MLFGESYDNFGGGGGFRYNRGPSTINGDTSKGTSGGKANSGGAPFNPTDYKIHEKVDGNPGGYYYFNEVRIIDGRPVRCDGWTVTYTDPVQYDQLPNCDFLKSKPIAVSWYDWP